MATMFSMVLIRSKYEGGGGGVRATLFALSAYTFRGHLNKLNKAARMVNAQLWLRLERIRRTLQENA